MRGAVRRADAAQQAYRPRVNLDAYALRYVAGVGIRAHRAFLFNAPAFLGTFLLRTHRRTHFSAI